MFDPFFRWLESTALSVWIVESPSLFAFPGILAAHTVGLGLLAGLSSALDLRLLGIARNIPPVAFTRLLPVMWFGLWVNVLTGIALVNTTFGRVKALGPGAQSPPLARLSGAVSLVLWVTVIVCGRMITFFRPGLCRPGGTLGLLADCIVR